MPKQVGKFTLYTKADLNTALSLFSDDTVIAFGAVVPGRKHEDTQYDAWQGEVVPFQDVGWGHCAGLLFIGIPNPDDDYVPSEEPDGYPGE